MMHNLIDVPLFENSAEDVHCAQVALHMVLKYHFPDRAYTLAYLDAVTHHFSGGWTWDTPMLNFLIGAGFEIVVWSAFDYLRFAQEGEVYLREIWSDEELSIQKLNADLTFERQLALDFWSHKKPQLVWNKCIARVVDVKQLFDAGYLVVASVNPYILDGDDGEAGHWIIITGYNETHVAFNDSDTPPEKDRVESWSRFAHARAPLSSLFAVRLST